MKNQSVQDALVISIDCEIENDKVGDRSRYLKVLKFYDVSREESWWDN